MVTGFKNGEVKRREKFIFQIYLAHIVSHLMEITESEFVNLLRNPRIDSLSGGPVRQPYLTYRPARLHRLAESIPWPLKRLQIRALSCNLTIHKKTKQGKGGASRQDKRDSSGRA